MTFIEICPDCQNPVKCYEAGDGSAEGKCLCGRTVSVGTKQTDIIPDGPSGPSDRTPTFFAYNIVGDGAIGRGEYLTLHGAEVAATTYAKKGQKCRVVSNYKTVSEWTDGERDDLKRKHIKVWFDYKDYNGNPASGSTEIIEMLDTPFYKCIEYYLTHSFQITKYVITDDDGKILEEGPVASIAEPSSCTTCHYKRDNPLGMMCIHPKAKVGQIKDPEKACILYEKRWE